MCGVEFISYYATVADRRAQLTIHYTWSEQTRATILILNARIIILKYYPTHL
jgi:hypothetical protein